MTHTTPDKDKTPKATAGMSSVNPAASMSALDDPSDVTPTPQEKSATVAKVTQSRADGVSATADQRHGHVDNSSNAHNVNNNDGQHPERVPQQPAPPSEANDNETRPPSVHPLTPENPGLSFKASARSDTFAMSELYGQIQKDICDEVRFEAPVTNMLSAFLARCALDAPGSQTNTEPGETSSVHDSAASAPTSEAPHDTAASASTSESVQDSATSASHSQSTQESLLIKVLDICRTLCEEPTTEEAIATHLAEYRSARTDEKVGHEPFALFVNKLLDMLEEQENREGEEGPFDHILKGISKLQPRMIHLEEKQLEHLYTTTIKGVKGSNVRRPDCVFISKSLKEKIEATGPQAIKNYKFEWSEILMTWEMKLRSHGEFPAPPDDFDTNYIFYTPLKDGALTRSSRGAARYMPVADQKPIIITPGKDKVVKQKSRTYKKIAIDRSTTSNTASVAVSGIAHESSGSATSAATIGTSSDSEEFLNKPSDTGITSSFTDSLTQNKSLKRPREDEENGAEDPEASRPSKKQPKSYSLRDANKQNAMYGCEMLCRGPYALHSINPLVVDDTLWLWWFDRSTTLVSGGLNFVQNLPYFIALLAAFQRFDLKNWGVASELVPPSIFLDDAKTLRKQKVNVRFDDKVDATFAIPKRLPHPGLVLRGRATIVLDAQSNSEDPDNAGKSLHGKDLVIKIYWPEETRSNEADIIVKARGQLSTDMLKHMPRLIATCDIPYSGTKQFYSECAVPPDPDHPDKRHSSRILRLLLFRKLVPLQELKGGNDVVKALKDSFTCHYFLWQKGIEHGDISVWNIMWDPTDECGVLNDWDLALVVGDERKNKERTGTLPFMARDLLLKLSNTRLYRHEVESFIWVFIWICLGGTNNATVKGWHTGSHMEVASQKAIFFTSYVRERANARFKDAWEICENLLDLLDRVDSIVSFPKRHKGVDQPNDKLLFEAFMAIMDGKAGYDLPLYY